MSSATARSSRITATEVIGEILITLGVLLLLFAFYEAFWTNVDSGQRQQVAQDELEEEWHNPRTHHLPALGDAFARLYIPSFGTDYQYAVLEGTDDETLLAGPGHYSDTQLPGEPGNFAVAGHRVGKGAPFNDLGRLETCDALVVETRDKWITYRMLPLDLQPAERERAASACLGGRQLERVAHGDYSSVMGRHITLPADTSVLNPLPGGEERHGKRESQPGLERVITLTTCHPQFSNAERMIIHAVQTDVKDKSAGLPDVFAGADGERK